MCHWKQIETMKKDSECKLCKCPQVEHIMVEKGICGPEKEDYDISLFHVHNVSVDIIML